MGEQPTNGATIRAAKRGTAPRSVRGVIIFKLLEGR
jgi:hypothetical protein